MILFFLETHAAPLPPPPLLPQVNRDHAVLDFIWCSRHMPVSAVLRPLQPELRELVAKHYMPNRWHPSDHLPIGAVLRLTPPPADAANGGADGGSGAAAGLAGLARHGSTAASDAGSSVYAPST